MWSTLLLVVSLCLPTSPPTWPWMLINIRPNDPTLSCYAAENGTWVCASDRLLLQDVDSEDSY